MDNDPLNGIVFSRDAIEFVTVANEYCNFLEKKGEVNARDFLEKIQKLLPLLYLKVSLLPEFEPGSDESPEKFVSELDYNLIQQKIAGMLGEHDDYEEIFDTNMQFSESALTESISEDLTDIYQDLKDFVNLYQIGNEDAMEAGLWECLNNFKNFWGQKLVNCLRAVHQLVFSDTNFDGQQSVRVHPGKQPTGPEWLNRKFENEED